MPTPAMRHTFVWTTFASALACVYFQASGVSALLAQRFHYQTPDQPLEMASAAPFPQVARVTSAALLLNNPFDWRVALIPPLEATSIGESPKTHETVDPLRAVTCLDVSLSIVTQSSDRSWSVGVMKTTAEQTGVPRHWGEKVGDYEVAYIGYNHLRASPAVWLTHSAGLCQLLLFDRERHPKTATTKARPEPPGVARKSRATRTTSALPAEIADGITKVSDTQVAIDRAVVDQVLQEPAMFMETARLVPSKLDTGHPSTIRLTGVRPGSLLSALNLANGDLLSSINGYDLGNPEQALAAYARLRTATTLTLEVVRAGNRVTLEATIR